MLDFLFVCLFVCLLFFFVVCCLFLFFKVLFGEGYWAEEGINYIKNPRICPLWIFDENGNHEFHFLFTVLHTTFAKTIM